MRVIAVDPGRMTGFCYAQIKNEQLYYHPFQMPDDVDEFWDRLSEFKPTYVIIEDFAFRGNARRGLDLFPVQLIGVARLYEFKSSLDVKVFLQTPAYGKSYYTNPILKQKGLYKPGAAWEHAMDASRHLLQWATFGYGYQFMSSAQDALHLVSQEEACG